MSIVRSTWICLATNPWRSRSSVGVRCSKRNYAVAEKILRRRSETPRTFGGRWKLLLCCARRAARPIGGSPNHSRWARHLPCESQSAVSLTCNRQTPWAAVGRQEEGEWACFHLVDVTLPPPCAR